ncbi:unnamed protein product, partial [Didymodactylos carnosus]
MKAAVLTSFQAPLEIKQVPIPIPNDDEVLVKLIACGVCHSDLHLAHGDWDLKPPLPRILGHEGVGEVVKLGKNVNDNYEIKLGDIIGVPWIRSTCSHCEYCCTSRETLCAKQLNSGFSVEGCFAEYA